MTTEELLYIATALGDDLSEQSTLEHIERCYRKTKRGNLFYKFERLIVLDIVENGKLVTEDKIIVDLENNEIIFKI